MHRVSKSNSVASDILTFPWTEIGVALTTFGAIFMLLGVMLFFDGALLALGNVRNHAPSLLLASHSASSDSVSVWSDTDYRASKDLLLLCSQAKTTRLTMLLRWNSFGLLQMAVYRCRCRNIRFLEFVWVRVRFALHAIALH